MAGNTFGQLFRITTFGESHGPALGVVIDGCPPGLAIDEELIQKELRRRKPGQDALTTPRKEDDQVEILSGIFEGKSTGTPIALLIRNENAHSKDYDSLKEVFRPGHADATYLAKYGIRDHRGGGRASARETAARVAAGAIAKALLAQHGIEIFGYVHQIGIVKISKVERDFIEQNPLRCPDPTVLDAMTQEVQNAKDEGDSVGGVVEIIALNVPAGLGEPVFDKLSADLAKAICSLPAVKAFEIGEGANVHLLKGSQNNVLGENKAGGILGGISTGEPIVLRFTLKPPSSIAKTQEALNKQGEKVELSVQGRHDPCVCQRAVPIGEAMVALTLADHLLRQKVNH